MKSRHIHFLLICMLLASDNLVFSKCIKMKNDKKRRGDCQQQIKANVNGQREQNQILEEKNVAEILGNKHRSKTGVFEKLNQKLVSAKEFMYHLYRSTKQDFLQKNINVSIKVIKEVDTIVSLVNINSLTARPNASDETGSMYFELQANLIGKTILASELRIFLDENEKTISDRYLKLYIYEIILPKKRYILLNSRVIDASKSGWHGFDVLGATRRWKKGTSQNNGILVVCQTLQNERKQISDCGLKESEDGDKNTAFLLSFYKSGSEHGFSAEQIPEKYKEDNTVTRIRKQRDSKFYSKLEKMIISDHKGRPIKMHGIKKCKKHKLEINFSKLGYGDLHPQVYDIGKCGGECKMNINSDRDPHATIQILLNIVSPDSVPPPCCAPVKLKPLGMLEIKQSNVIFKNMEDLVVEKCGCQ